MNRLRTVSALISTKGTKNAGAQGISALTVRAIALQESSVMIWKSERSDAPMSPKYSGKRAPNSIVDITAPT